MPDREKEVSKIEQGDAWEEGDEIVQVEVSKTLDKVIPLRLSSDKWEELREEAREMGIGPTTLARMWILERLRRQVETYTVHTRRVSPIAADRVRTRRPSQPKTRGKR